MSYIGNSFTTQGFVPAIAYFSGNGSTTAFTVPYPVSSVAQLIVYVNNVPQNPSSAFTVNGNVITFTSAPSSGTNNIWVEYASPITQVTAPSPQTVGLAQLSASGSPSSSTYLRGDNSWASIPFGNGGATITSTGSNLTLTNASNKVQEVTMTAANLAVILPDATTYTSTTVGTPVFTIANSGTNSFDVITSTGYVVVTLTAGQSCIISLAGNTTQLQWIGTQSNFGVSNIANITRGSSTTITTTVPTWNSANQNIQVVALSSTLLLAVWLNSNTGYSYACAGTISGTVITWGTPTAISTARAYNFVNIAALSSTTALIGSIAVGTGSYYNGVSISGTTITVSTISAAGGTGDSTQYPLLPLTSTTAILFYGVTSSGVVGRIVTYNGASAPTFGTAVNNPYTTGPEIHPVVLSSTSVLCITDNAGASRVARQWSISGTTLTLSGTVATLNTALNTGSGSALFISATEAIFTTNATTSVQKLTISGTVVTASTVWTPNYKVLAQNDGANQLLSSTDFLATAGGSPTAFTRYSYNTSTGVAIVGNSSFPIPITPYGYCYVTTNTAAVVGLDSNNYPSGYLVYIS